MDRRKFIATLGAAGATVALSGAAWAQAKPETTKLVLGFAIAVGLQRLEIRLMPWQQREDRNG